MFDAKQPDTRPDPRDLYTRRLDQYVRFVSAFRHQQGLEGLFLHSGLVRDGMRALDAGCGTGFATFALLGALRRRRFRVRGVDAFDLTPAMLERFRHALEKRRLATVRLREADVLRLDTLPDAWTGYDLIFSVSMLEYVPRAGLPAALAALRARLAPGGSLLVVITRRNPLTRVLIEQWWQADRYTRPALVRAFAQAGFASVDFVRYPLRHFWLGCSNHVVVAPAKPRAAGPA